MKPSIINIGLTNELSFREKRELQIVNTISVIFGTLLPISALFNFIQGEIVNALMILVISTFYFLNLIWNRLHWYILSKIVVCYGITIVPFLNLLISGTIPDGQFLSLTIVAIVFATASTILFDRKTEKFLYYFSTIFYILWILFIDFVIIALSNTEPEIDFILENYIYYKLPPILGLLALSIIVTYFKNLIFKYEVENEEVNLKLAHQNQELEKRVVERTAELTKTMEKIVKIVFLNSHELRGPLTAIMSATEFLKDSPNEKDAEEVLTQLHTKSEEMDLAIRKMNDVLQETIIKS